MRWTWLLVLALACGDDDGTTDPDGGTDTGADVTIDVPMMDVGNGDASDAPDTSVDPCEGEALLEPLATAPSFAVIGTDFTSTSLGLLDASGDVHTDAWIDSGTTGAGLVATLGGDVVLPTTSTSDAIELIDRFGVDVGTRLCPNGVVLGQVAFSPGDFATNVHDWVAVSAREAWATRYEKNPDGSAPDAERGNDLIAFDRELFTLGPRIDLGMFDEDVSGLDSSGAEVTVPVAARPDTVVSAGGVLVVGLGRLPENLFGDSRGHGDGRVAIVDPSDSSVTGVELTGLANCGQVVPVAGTDDEVLVSCLGYSNVGFGDVAGERATAGLARISLPSGNIESLWRVSDDEARLLGVYGLVSLGGDVAVAVAPGDFVATNDTLVRVDLGSGEQTTIVTGDGSFVLGQGAYDGTSLLLVPDTGVGVRRFDTSDGFSEQEAVTIGPSALPPTMIRAL